MDAKQTKEEEVGQEQWDFADEFLGQHKESSSGQSFADDVSVVLMR